MTYVAGLKVRGSEVGMGQVHSEIKVRENERGREISREKLVDDAERERDEREK